MGATKKMFNTYREMQSMYCTDIDLSGGLFIEYQPKLELKVTVTNFGYFYKGTLDGVDLKKEELFNLLRINYSTALRLEYHLIEFEKSNPEYNVCISEIDVT